MIIGLGLYVGLMTLALFRYVQAAGVELKTARTIAFHAIIVVEWFNVLNFRTLRVPVLKTGLFSNRWMLLAIGVTFAVQLGALYIPLLQHALNTVPLSLRDWGLIAAVSLPIFLLGEAAKWWFHRTNRRQAS